VKLTGFAKTLTLASASVALAFGLAGTASAVDITWMHVETNENSLKVWQSIADAYQKDHPDVNIQLQFLENEAYKAKLPALLQSAEAPDMFYTWGGGVLDIQRSSGFLMPLTEAMDADGGAWRNTFAASAVNGLTFEDEVWAAPVRVGTVAFFYNKEMFEKAGVDGAAIKTWGDFIGAVEKIKAAGMVPLGCDGADKWPLHFYYSYLIMRNGGEGALAAVKAKEPDAFLSDGFIKAGEQMIELGATEPCQPGWEGSHWPSEMGELGDARVAMALSFEDTERRQKQSSTSGEGLAEGNLGRFVFPVVEGGLGDPAATFGGLNGWAVSKTAPPETIDFLKFYTSIDNQRLLARETGIIPVVKGADDAIATQFVRDAAIQLSDSDYHQNYLDQDLGPNLGRTVNDVSVELWAGRMTAEEAAQTLQDTADLE
jgi:raffinose/stachyose/melibiose transport system substrate-binding protein